ncbi:ATP citrate synthase [Candidatus Micrarchaeota archaeon]|nr:ATP citrate synthase [Candidatus Micrarchaeota archaeon]
MTLFDENTQAIIFGMQAQVVQRMLDFDFMCGRKTPSVAAVVNPSDTRMLAVFFGSKQVLVPVYASTKEAFQKHPVASVFINFASFRSAFDTTWDALDLPQVLSVAVIAEGMPERDTRRLAAKAKKLSKPFIGPATVGGLTAGCFKIGNTGGAVDAMIDAKLYRSGSVGFVSKSGGMSNELFNLLSHHTDGVCEGIAIGGDRFPGTTLYDHVQRFEKDPKIKLIVVLGELGGTDEYDIADAVAKKKIKKPVVAWVTGTCAALFATEVQFGHAGAKSGSKKESAQEKNEALKKAGVFVPKSYDDFGELIQKVFEKHVGKIPAETQNPPVIPEDFSVAVKKNRVRRPASIVSSISDDRGEDVLYHGETLTSLLERKASLGDVIALLWFKKKLPAWATEFMEMTLKITADHGPAVSGAHNAIVASRAGKDLVSCLASGLLTIGPRFGGAIDDAARYWQAAVSQGQAPKAFVDEMKAKNVLIPGIGHRVKSIQNPDARVAALKAYAQKHFPSTQHLQFALDVEKLTTQKKGNLILNVDGCIAALFLDLFDSCPEFSGEEKRQLVDIGVLNAFFALGRSIGMIGHAIDQKRLQQPLYRHDWDDVLYL